MDKEETRKELRKRADELLESIKDELYLCVICLDVDRLGRLIELYAHHPSYELLKALRDKGFSEEITKLAKKAGEVNHVNKSEVK